MDFNPCRAAAHLNFSFFTFHFTLSSIPVGSDPQIAPPTCANVRQTGDHKGRPYGADERSPVGEGLATPADLRRRPTTGRGKPRPYAANRQAGGYYPPLRSGRRFPPVGSDPQIAPPTCANVRQTGRRGRRPLRRKRTFPQSAKKSPSDKGQRGRVRVFRRSSSAFR